MWRTRHGQWQADGASSLASCELEAKTETWKRILLEFCVCVCLCVWRGNTGHTDFGATPKACGRGPRVRRTATGNTVDMFLLATYHSMNCVGKFS